MRLTLTRLILLAATLTLWELLFPFNFTTTPQSAWLGETDIHKINLAGNLLLFAPLGLLLGWWFQRRSTNRHWAIILVALVGGLLSLSGETLQVFLPERQSSIVDLLANTLGITLAGIVGYARGHRLDHWLSRLARRLPTGRPARRLGWVILAIFIARTAPFDLTPETRELRLALQQTYESGLPFSAVTQWLHHPNQSELWNLALWQLTAATLNATLFFMLALTLARALRWRYYRHQPRRSPWLETAFLSGGFLIFTELLQWPIRSRVMDATDVVTGLVGIAVAILWDRMVPQYLAPGGSELPGAGARGSAQIASVSGPIPDQEPQDKDTIPSHGKTRQTLANCSSAPAPGSKPPGAKYQQFPYAVIAGICILAGLVGVMLPHLPPGAGVPYNLAELLGTGPQAFFRAAGMTLAVLLLGLLPTAIAQGHARFVGTTLRLLIASLIVAGLLTLVAPTESLHDLVGTPLAGRAAGWAWLGWGEVWLRLAGLILLPMSAVLAGLGGVACQDSSRDAENVLREDSPHRLPLFLAALVGLLVGRTVVITFAATDNLTELIAGTASKGDPFIARTWIAWPGELFLFAMLLLLGLNVAITDAPWRLFFTTPLTSQTPRRGRRGYKSLLLFLSVFTLITIPLSLWLFQLGTVNALSKYGQTFSAEQFLLGANRTATLPHIQILLRWGLVWVAMVIVLSLGTRLGRGLRLPRRAASESVSPAWCSPVFLLALPATLLIIYGSLLPFSFHWLTPAVAFKQFTAIMTLAQSVSANRLDWVVNFMLFGALALVWAGAWHVASPSTRTGVKVLSRLAAIWLGVLFLGAALEFAQLYLPARTTSPIDLLAQGLGAALGLLLWQWRGQRWTAFISNQSGQSSLPLRLLQLYLAAYILYALMPLDVVLSLHELTAKLHQGQIRPWPWPPLPTGSANLPRWLWNITGDIALAVPIGLLLAWRFAPIAKHGRAMLVGLLLLTAIEVAQLPLLSRVSDAADVTLGLLGIALGLLLHDLHRRGAYRPLLNLRRRWYALAATLYALILIAGYTWPWHFAAEPAPSLAAFFTQTPFANLLRGSAYVALDQLLRKSLLALPLGLLAGLVVKRHYVVALWPGVAALLVVELVQLVTVGHQADLTDIMLALPGLSAGAWLAVRLKRCRAKPQAFIKAP